MPLSNNIATPQTRASMIHRILALDFGRMYILQANEDVIFSAGLGVEIMATLDVELGASFEIKTEGCSP